MNSSRQLFQLARIVAARQITTSAVRSAAQDVHPGYKQIKELQKFFQKDDTLVHLKRGAVDALLYRLTIVLCAVALAMDFKLYYELACPKKKE